MRTRRSRFVAAVIALVAGGLAAFALRPSEGATTGTLAARNPAVEVRTQVIRRTIHIIRHEPAASFHASGSGGASAGHAATASAPVSTRTSGSHGSPSAPASAPVSTRTSGSHGSPSAPASAPVSTRTSGSHGAPSAPASAPVSTRTSGSTGASSGGSSGRPVTRSSGSGQKGRDDGGDGHNGGD
jgi:hypothetical protein